MKIFFLLAGLCLIASSHAAAAVPDSPALPGTGPLLLDGDLSARMVEGIDKFLLREIENAPESRAALWKRDFSSREAYETSVAANRGRLRKIIGAVDARLPVTALEYISSTAGPALVAETARYTIHAVRWPVFEGCLW